MPVAASHATSITSDKKLKNVDTVAVSNFPSHLAAWLGYFQNKAANPNYRIDDTHFAAAKTELISEISNSPRMIKLFLEQQMLGSHGVKFLIEFFECGFLDELFNIEKVSEEVELVNFAFLKFTLQRILYLISVNKFADIKLFYYALIANNLESYKITPDNFDGIVTKINGRSKIFTDMKPLDYVNTKLARARRIEFDRYYKAKLEWKTARSAPDGSEEQLKAYTYALDLSWTVKTEDVFLFRKARCLYIESCIAVGEIYLARDQLNKAKQYFDFAYSVLDEPNQSEQLNDIGQKYKTNIQKRLTEIATPKPRSTPAAVPTVTWFNPPIPTSLTIFSTRPPVVMINSYPPTRGIKRAREH